MSWAKPGKRTRTCMHARMRVRPDAEHSHTLRCTLLLRMQATLHPMEAFSPCVPIRHAMQPLGMWLYMQLGDSCM